jgi:RNA polymerase sigma-70 factor (ECF subfamily)
MMKSTPAWNTEDSDTSVSLIDRLRHHPDDHAAWGRFVDRYGPRILGWCRAWGIQDADAHDLTQIVLTKLLDNFQGFTYDPSRSFRGWLRKLTRHVWAESIRKKWPIVPGGDPRILSLIEGQEAREDFVKRIEREFDLELKEEAERRVRGRVEPHTWEAYYLVAEETFWQGGVRTSGDERHQCIRGQAQRAGDAQGGGQDPGAPAEISLIKVGP